MAWLMPLPLTNADWFYLCGAGVMPNMPHCQITRSTRFVRYVGIIKPNPATNPNHNLNHNPNRNRNK